MKISIITVSFNSSKTIARTLLSIANQSYNNVEHIVIDGASSDATMQVVEQHKTDTTKIVSEPDGGIYEAMNKGVALVTGDIVGFLNADDHYKNKDVLAQVALIMDAENLDALYGDVEFFRADDEQKIVRRYDSGRFLPDRLGWGWMPAHPAFFVRSRLFERFGYFDSNYRIAGDFEFIARLFSKSELRHRHLSEPLVSMQLGGISTSGLKATVLLNIEMMRACRSNSIPTNWLKMLSRYPLKLVEFFC